jgi:Zn-finger protein
MVNSYKFFENKQCKFYPCHKGLKEINCLFCYCPLYKTKKCQDKILNFFGCYNYSCNKCTFPHKVKNYEKIIKLLKDGI